MKMTKVQRPKSLIHGKWEKVKVSANGIKKVGKQTSVINPKNAKNKKQNVLQNSAKETNKLSLKPKGAKKDKISETAIPSTTKRFVLAPAESPTPKKPAKAKKVVAERTETSVTTKSKQLSSDENTVPEHKISDKAKKQVVKKVQSQGNPKSTEADHEAVETTSKKNAKKFEPIPVDEETFDAIVSVSNVENIANTLKSLVEKEVATKKTSIFGDYNYCLNVCSFKISNCPKRVYKLNLIHPMVDPTTDDVVIIVPDLKRGAKVEYDSTIEHYTDLFQEAGIEGLKIMPFNQLRNEFKTFEAKRKLASTYDYYLCDGRIAGQVAGFCGSIFQKPRTVFHTVRMTNTKNLKAEIKKALRRTAYKQLSKGDLITIPVGSDKFTSKQIAENILHVVSQLKTLHPGGIENIRGIDIKVNIRGTSSLPIYASTASGPDEVPNVIGTREQRMLKLKKQTNQILSKFVLTKEAELLQLNKAQIERKRQFKEARSELLAENGKANEANKEEDVGTEVPAKKARKTPKEAEMKSKRKTTTTKKEK